MRFFKLDYRAYWGSVLVHAGFAAALFALIQIQSAFDGGLPLRPSLKTIQVEFKKTAPVFLSDKTQNVARPATRKPRAVKFGLGIPSAPRNWAEAEKIEHEIAEKVLGEGALTAAVSDEYINGVPAGMRTVLNTRESVFYSYFQRIRAQLDHAWEQILSENLARYFRRGRTLASETEYVTKVLVTLSSRGFITRLQVIDGSGTRDLDDAAIKAFNKAGPFPNPPKGLVNASGTILVRWDFVLRT